MSVGGSVAISSRYLEDQICMFWAVLLNIEMWGGFLHESSNRRKVLFFPLGKVLDKKKKKKEKRKKNWRTHMIWSWTQVLLSKARTKASLGYVLNKVWKDIIICSKVESEFWKLHCRLYYLVRTFHGMPLRVVNHIVHLVIVNIYGDLRVRLEKQLWYLSYFLTSSRKFEMIHILAVLGYAFKGPLKTTWSVYSLTR